MAHVSLLDKIKRVLGEGRSGALITGLEGVPSVGAKLFVDETGDSYGSLGDPELDEHAIAFAGTFLQGRHEARAFSSSEINLRSGEWETARLLYERVQAEHALVICGAGHVGASLARLAALSGYRVTLIDDRPEFVQSSGFEGFDIELCVAADWPQAVADACGSGRSVSLAIVTRGHNEDELCLSAALKCAPDYIGMIGSRRRTNIVIERLRGRGFADEQLRLIHAPIGLDIGAVTPEEVAVAILAEIIADRRGARGLSLSDWRRS